ncbi:hypothetical protein [Pantoea sp. Z09]|uniref:hypothetical protein n=1 Tax=Pantoea sp. Z09 TaxID=2886821 RepID=UPI001EFC7CED|nr:hypothetical protein [Pantoea sp. Z09]
MRLWVLSASQALCCRRRRLKSLLQRTAGDERLHCRVKCLLRYFISGRIQRAFSPQRFSGRRQRFRVCLGLQPRYLTLRPRYIRNLHADFRNHLRGLQALLLFLFVKDRTDAVVGMLRIAAQVSQALLLAGLIVVT